MGSDLENPLSPQYGYSFNPQQTSASRSYYEFIALHIYSHCKHPFSNFLCLRLGEPSINLLDQPLTVRTRFYLRQALENNFE